MFSDTGRFDPKALAVLRKSFVEMKTLAERAGHEQALHRSIPAERREMNAMTPSSVIAGLDPAIHPSCEKDGCAGQARA